MAQGCPAEGCFRRPPPRAVCVAQELGNHIAYLRNRWKKGGMRRAVPPPAAAKAGAAPAKKRGARGAGGDGEEDDGDF